MRNKILTFLLVLLAFCQVAVAEAAQGMQRTYERVVIASDVHYPSKGKKPKKVKQIVKAKRKAMTDINSWQDVDLVVFLGDMVKSTGSEAEYAEASKFVFSCTKPKAFIAGNHELIYKDSRDAKGKLKHTTPEERAKRRDCFLRTYDLKQMYYAKVHEPYLFVYLSGDKLESKVSVELSEKQLAWLKETLATHKNMPTVIYCHAPLKGTLLPYSKGVDKEKNVANPPNEIEQILLSNPQVKLWVSGHMHTKVHNPSFAHKVNYFQGKVLNLHNPTWDREKIYTNSLYFYKDCIKIRTYDHSAGNFLPQYDRVVRNED